MLADWKILMHINNLYLWAVVVAQLVERPLPIPEVHGSNPVIGKNLYILNTCLLSTVYWKDVNKEKEAENGPFFIYKKTICTYKANLILGVK